VNGVTATKRVAANGVTKRVAVSGEIVARRKHCFKQVEGIQPGNGEVRVWTRYVTRSRASAWRRWCLKCYRLGVTRSWGTY
jgi:hypothetical protein